MENVKSLFTRNVWMKLATNEKLMQNGKPAKYGVVVPNFEVKKNGEIIDAGEFVIKTQKEAYAYENRYKDVMDVLNQKYPDISVVRRIFTASLKEAISELSGNWADTTSGKILRGKSTSNARVFQNMYGTDPVNTVAGFLNTLKTYDGKDVVLPKVKKTKASVMKQFAKNPVGYYIPEITAKGLVVRPLVGSGNTAFDVNCSAFNSKDVSREQVVEYFKAPFGNAKVDVDFGRVVELSEMAYSAIGTDEFLPKVKLLVDYITANYPLSFEKIKKDKVQEKHIQKGQTPAQKSVNEQLKKKVDEFFKTPVMLPEATAQTLTDEARTCMTIDDAKNMDEQRRNLVSLIHKKVEEEKLKQEAAKTEEKLPKGVEVVFLDEDEFSDGMPELDIEELRNNMKDQTNTQPKAEEPAAEIKNEQVEEPKDEAVILQDEKDPSHYTFIINNNYFFGAMGNQITQEIEENDKVLEDLIPAEEEPVKKHGLFGKRASKVKKLDGNPVWESKVNTKERE